jgi:hypothetical protein
MSKATKGREPAGDLPMIDEATALPRGFCPASAKLAARNHLAAGLFLTHGRYAQWNPIYD